jgi:uncharacterized protein (UPF0333 family)
MEFVRFLLLVVILIGIAATIFYKMRGHKNID